MLLFARVLVPEVRVTAVGTRGGVAHRRSIGAEASRARERERRVTEATCVGSVTGRASVWLYMRACVDVATVIIRARWTRDAREIEGGGTMWHGYTARAGTEAPQR